MSLGSPEMFGVALMAMWGTAGAVAFGRSAAKSPAMRELAAAVRKMNLAAKGALVAGLVCAVAIGGTKPGGNDPQRQAAHPVSAMRTVAGTNAPPFALVEVRTNGVSFASATSNAIVSKTILRRGTSEGGEWIETETPFFHWGTNPVSRVFASQAVLSFGSMRHPALGATLPDGTPAESLVALRTPLGLVPEANGSRLAAPSRFWHEETAFGRVFTWENALLDRKADRPATVQIETRDDGDFVYRYDFSDAAPTNGFFIGAQLGSAAVEALGVRGGVTNAATVYRVDGAPVPSGVFVADFFTAPRLELRWRNVAGLGDLSGDEDGDGLSDWDEIFRYDTDPHQSDTDGDGLSDSSEILSGANPLDTDENGDGIPDGVSAEAWTSDPIWAENSGKTNLVVTLGTAIPDGAAASLVLGSVTIPLRSARHYVFGIPVGVEVPFRLFSRGVAAVDLSMSNALPGQPAPLLRSSTNRPQKEFNGPCLRLHDLLGVFDGKQAKGEGFVAEPRIYLRCESGNDDMVASCIHGDGFCVYSIVTEPASCAFELHEADEIDGFQIQQGKFVSLYVTDEPGDSDYGYIRFGPKYHCWGDADIYHGIHRCEGGRHVWCHVCGTHHDDWNACSHEPDCAAVLDASADCTCGGLYVHVAWRDEDGNGTPDLADDHLVGGGGAATFTALGRVSDDCCCSWAYEQDGLVRIQSVSSNLRLWANATNQLHAGDTGTVFAIQATAPSPSVGGSHVVYEIVGPSNDVRRTITLPITAWDIWDTGLAFNHNPTDSTSDAINLREDYTTPYNCPNGEWIKVASAAHNATPNPNYPACWIAGVRPTVKARFEVLPADISNAVLSAISSGHILSDIPQTTVVFSNGVTRALVGTDVTQFSTFALDSTVPTMVSRSTNEVWTWSIQEINGHGVSNEFIATNGPSVAYSILAEPVEPWVNNRSSIENAWETALAFIVPSACDGAASEQAAVAQITSFLFSGCGLVYDTYGAENAYADPYSTRHGSLFLSRFIARSSGSVVNCADQALLVSAFSKLVGVDARAMVMSPFGYINESALLLLPSCNNPLFSNPKYDPRSVCPINSPTRSGFGYHMFVESNGKVFDACVGPHLGTETLSAYLSSTIDTITTNTTFVTGVSTNVNQFILDWIK